MTEIKYVCISDLHLGEEDSLLTCLKEGSPEPEPLATSPVLGALARCFRALIEECSPGSKPTLVLAGDALELALATDRFALMGFERLLESFMPQGAPLFEEIVFIPGNHDHHLWELARESQYIDHLSSIAPGAQIPDPWHTTSCCVDHRKLPPSFTLTRVAKRYPHLSNFKVRTAYPNFGAFDPATRRCVVFSHGHYTESLYHLMTSFTDVVFPDRVKPSQIWDIEAENFAWIDFFWSTMGRSGDVGTSVEKIYESLKDKKRLDEVLASLAKGLAKKHDLPGFGDAMEEKILRAVFKVFSGKFVGTERGTLEEKLSADATDGLRTYLRYPLATQLKSELGGTLPDDMTFVFGHTHKPFERDMSFDGYPRWVNVYNTGGWVVETVEPAPTHGASIVVVDETLRAAAIRVYNETSDPDGYAVRVHEASHEGEPKSALATLLEKTIQPRLSPWRDLSSAIREGIAVRAQNLRDRIAEKI